MILWVIIMRLALLLLRTYMHIGDKPMLSV